MVAVLPPFRRAVPRAAPPAEDGWLARLPEPLREIGRDLLSIEANTVIKPGMTARKMPELPHALLDIAEDYGNAMERLGIDLTGWWTYAGRAPETRRVTPPVLRGGPARHVAEIPYTCGSDTFDRLRWAAAGVLATVPPRGAVADADRVVLFRIRRNSDELKGLVDALAEADAAWQAYLVPGVNRAKVVELLRKAPALPPVRSADMTLLRKAWDIGTEYVVMQTVIQLDGDVLNRLDPKAFEDGRQEALLKVHSAAVSYALGYWGALFGVLRGLAGFSRAEASATPPGGVGRS